jgi:solute carrier family 10 (sodium/bile acid cotransporter), member 7
VQSSIAFTSTARGHVSAAIVSASLSNILGEVPTPLLAVRLMNTTCAPRVDGTAVRDIVLQLLLPFGAGQLARPWIAGVIARYATLLKVVDRGSILLVVCTAFSMGVVEGIWLSVDAWRLILVTIVALTMLPLMIFHQIQLVVCAVIASRLARHADDSGSASTRSGAGRAVPAPDAGEKP